MKKKWVAIIGSGALFTGLIVAGASLAEWDEKEVTNGTVRVENQTEVEFPAMIRITMDQAVQKAMARVPGQVLKTELEDENGFLVYGIEMVTGDQTIVKVMVDAGSGTVLASEQDKADNGEDES
jgi:uncharacterized membrane protein YkoI